MSISENYASAAEWNCALVSPDHSALHRSATVDPFSGNIDWAAREKQMFQCMADHFGVGLAAPQVGSSYNMFVMRHSVLGNIGVYKPRILESSTEKCVIEEGCLSWPLLYLRINRAEKILVHFYKNDGETQVETWMAGIDARCFLHEFDHLQGINFIDIVSDFKLRRAKQARDNLIKNASRRLK